MSIHYTDDAVTLWHGDCLDVMRQLPDASVDAVVTDPPYGLEFMGKEWDAPWQRGAGIGEHSAGFSKGAPAAKGVRGEIKSLPSYTGTTNPTCRTCGGTRNGNDRASRKRCSCEQGDFPNVTLPRMLAFESWCTEWATEALRVLKPGGHLLAFGGTRTWHRLACAIEDAGFEVRDSIAWMYGSGFPKSLDVSKAMDKAARGVPQGAADPTSPNHGKYRTTTTEGKRWQGDSGQGYGAGGSRFLADGAVSDSGMEPVASGAVGIAPSAAKWQGWGTALKPAFEPVVVARKPLIGTVAANVERYGTGALNIDGARVGTGEDRAAGGESGSSAIWGQDAERLPRPEGGRWPANVILDESQAAELDRQSGVLTSGYMKPTHTTAGASGRPTAYGSDAAGGFTTMETYGDTGGASRFFYTAKADSSERPRVDGVAHPTVKPLDLMRYLVRLVTPPGGVVLEPFAGSGTTLEACIVEGFQCIGIEREADYIPLIMARISKPIEVTLL